MTYSYQDGDSYVFMDNERMNNDTAGRFPRRPERISAPNMEVQITSTTTADRDPASHQRGAGSRRDEPGIRNATATNSFKPAKMETGITVQFRAS